MEIEKDKIERISLEGELFILVEEDLENEDVIITAEVGGINLWDWLSKHNGYNVKIVMELER